MKRTFTVFLLLFGLSAFGQHAIALLEIPEARFSFHSRSGIGNQPVSADIIRGMWVVNASLNGKTGAFILDTGAPMLAVNRMPASKSDIVASGFSGKVEVGTTQVDQFNWSGINLRDFTALELDISHIEAVFGKELMGLIGFEVIRGNEIYFDYASSQIQVLDPNRNPLHRYFEPATTVPLTFDDHLPIVNLMIGGKSFKFGIDTGAGINLLNNRAVENIPQELLVKLPNESIQGLDQDVKECASYELTEAFLGKEKLEQVRFSGGDLTQLKALTGLELDGIIGFPLLRQLKFSINYPKETLYIWDRTDL